MTSDTFFLRTAGKSSLHCAGVIDQRILAGAKTDVGIGILHDLEDRQGRIHADAPSPDDAFVAHFR